MLKTDAGETESGEMMRAQQGGKVIAKEWLTQDAVSMTLAVGDMMSSAIVDT